MRGLQRLAALSMVSMLIYGCMPIPIIVATGSAISVSKDRRTTGTIVDDQAIELKAHKAFMKHKEEWEKSHIGICSFNNKVLLVGQTRDPNFKRIVEEEVINIPRVEQVFNEISIDEPISLTQRSKDTWITAVAKTRILGHKELGAKKIKVITENNVVYLIGIVSAAEEDIAIDLVRNIKGVEKVVKIFDYKK